MINENKLRQLIEKGVKIPAPYSVEIGDDVDPDRISGEGVTIHSGSRIYGKTTFISKGCTIGKEGPVTVDHCWLAPNVKINGGYAKQSVFLNKSSAGYGAHIREGTILEEEANCAHTVGLKQTILFPFVTLGSLINFCDCFMAGGTDRKNHSEVGSSYIHFNYTPNQDKATASMFGDVPRGVMLNNRPVFLGGQGGSVGPLRISYGTVIAAGTIQRKDELEPDRLLFGGGLKAGNIKHTPGIFTNTKRVIQNNLNYIANLIALQNWYRHVRVLFISENFPSEIIQGLNATLLVAIDERIKRLKDYMEKAVKPPEFLDGIESELRMMMDTKTDLSLDKRCIFLNKLENVIQTLGNSDYIKVIKQLDQSSTESGTGWLSDIVNHVNQRIMSMIPVL